MLLHRGDKNKPLKEPLIRGNTISYKCGIHPYSPHPAQEEGELQHPEVTVGRCFAIQPEGQHALSHPQEAASIPSFVHV